VSQIPQLFHYFNWHSPSWDLFIFAAWILGSVIYAFTAGRGRIINILMSIYIAKLLVYEAPFLSHAITQNLPSPLLALQQLATFVIVFLVMFMFLGRYAFRTSADGRQLAGILFGLIFSVLQIGLLINTILGFLPITTQENFQPLIQLLFIRNPASFAWLVAPLVFLIVLGKFVADPNEF
jgi:hypothetical protein